MTDKTNQIMILLHLDEYSKKEVREFFKKTMSIQLDQDDFDDFLRQLKPSLKIKI